MLFSNSLEKLFFREKKDKVPIHINHECKLVMDKQNRFYFHVLSDVEIKKKDRFERVVALDPGVKIFQTLYDNQDQAYMVGENDIKKINELHLKAERMRNGKKILWQNFRYRTNQKEEKIKIGFDPIFVDCKTSKERKSLLKAANRVETKIKNLINDLHHKLVKFLCFNYDVVIIPLFESQKMAEKHRNNIPRKINKDTTRNMLRWSHYKFRQLLIDKGEVEGTKIIVGTEEYTSKTCGNCFYIDQKLGGKRQYNCPKCFYMYHRDIGAARNIMILNSPLIQ